MFTPVERDRIRDDLIAAARDDDEIVGAALVGSAATGREDAWSDIDLALQVDGDVDPGEVAERWTAAFYGRHGVAHHLDVVADGVLYRVFLLASSLQVDVSFWPGDRFRATEAGFTLLFGTAQPPTEPGELESSREIGMAWLYALHSRSAIARGHVWQATMMLDHLRDQLLVLACLRHDLRSDHGREADRLPADVLDALRHARATTPTTGELTRSHQAMVRLLSQEIAEHDHGLSARLGVPLEVLAGLDVW